MTDVQLLAKMRIDAAKWTEEFLVLFPEGTNDWGTLVGWFANAIEVGRDAGHSSREVGAVEVISLPLAAMRKSATELLEEWEPRHCDSDGVSGCHRCRIVAQSRRTIRIVEALGEDNIRGVYQDVQLGLLSEEEE